MNELEIQKFLRNTPDGIAELKARFGVDAKPHPKYPNLVLFKYDQIGSPFKERIVQEARGIVLDKDNNWNVVAMGFTKFFNYGEPEAAPINWARAEVQEKLDGSLIMLYWYDNQWQVATSGTPDAGGQVNLTDMTFSDLFWKVADEQGLRLNYLGKDFSWVFELCTPYNRVVVDHKDCKIWAIGARHKVTLLEWKISPEFCKTCKAYFPKRYPLYSTQDCVKAAAALDPMKNEGFVVVDDKNNRVKIKSPAYIMLHHAKDSLSKKRMCEIIRQGEENEFKLAIESLPELKALFEDVVSRHVNVVLEAELTYDRIKGIESQKEFALEANKTKAPSLLFTMRKTGQNATQCTKSEKMSLQHYMAILGLK